MGNLHLVKLTAGFSWLSADGWYTLGFLILCVFVLGFVSTNWFEASIVCIRNIFARRLGRGDRPPDALAKCAHALLVNQTAGLAGTLLALTRTLDAKTFDWYVTRGLTVWPDFGSIIPWLVNAVFVLAFLGVLGLLASSVKAAGWVAGTVTTMVVIFGSLGSFALGLFAWQLVLPISLVIGAKGRRNTMWPPAAPFILARRIAGPFA